MSGSKRQVGRPTDYRPEYCQMIIDHMESGASVGSFAASISVARSTINLWAAANPEFMEALQIGKAKAGAWWEQRGRQIALEGGGPGASNMTMFGLKNFAPEDFRDKQEIAHTSPDGSMSPAPTTIRIIAADDRSDD